MKTALDPRHLKRQKIVQELFAKNANSKSKISDPKSTLIIKTIAQIDQIVKDAAPEWEISKINQMDLAILRLAVYELCFELTEPSKVIIDEAVELAKEFGGENSPTFINGALGKALFAKSRIRKIIANKLGIEEEKLVPEASLTTDLNATDLEIADLITVLENDLSISAPHPVRLQTIGQLLEYLDEHEE